MRNKKLNILKIIISLILFVAFVVFNIKNNTDVNDIVGTILFIILLYTLVKIFIDVNNDVFEFDLLFIIEFILNLGMMIYLLYSLPNTTLQIILTTLVASTYGGLIALGLIRLFFNRR